MKSTAFTAEQYTILLIVCPDNTKKTFLRDRAALSLATDGIH